MGVKLTPRRIVLFCVIATGLLVGVGFFGYYIRGRRIEQLRSAPRNASLQTPKQCEHPEERCNARLNPEVIPTNYELFLFPNFTSGNFSGEVEISINIRADQVDHIRLHVKYLEINGTILRRGNTTFNVTGYEVKELEYWVIRSKDGESFTKGTYHLNMTFNGSLTRDILGFYKSSYMDTEANLLKYVVSSKFQSTYARRAFPCFDEPGFKSTFHLTLIRPSELVAISNMPIEEEKANQPIPGLTTVKFEKSVPMVTYLLAFAIGDLSYVERKTKRGIPVRIYTTTFQINNANYAANITHQIIDYFEEYFNIHYPLPKLDVVGIPDFISGAMEHWGMISFRESNLLYQPGVASAFDKQRIASVLAHELAHMWFGNLMTLKWWNDLWLNEGFASYMEYKGVNAVHPEWEIETQFVGEDLVPILGLDGQHSSHPIVQEVTNPNQITELFDRISYSKGASVIRMLENFLGTDSFRRGVTAFLKKFSYSNAVTEDLWKYLQSETTSDVFNISLVMDTWTRQMGYPVIYLEQLNDTGGHWIARQERFLDNRDPDIKGTESSFGYRWQIPLTFQWENINNASKPTQLVWMRHTNDTVSLAVEKDFNWLKLNVGSVGYFRVRYVDSLYPKMKNLLQLHFTPAERCSAFDDAFSLAFADYLRYNVTLDFSLALRGEEHYIAWNCAKDHIINLGRLLKANEPDTYTIYKNYVLYLVTPIYSDLIWTNREMELHQIKLLKPLIFGLACNNGHLQCLNKTKILFDRWIDYPVTNKISPELRNCVYKWGIYQSENDKWDKVFDIYLRESDPQERIRLLRALSFSKDLKILKNFLELAKNETIIKRQDYFTLFKFYTLNPLASNLAWDFYREEYKYLVDRFSLNHRYFGRIIVDLTFDFATPTKLKEVQDFFALYPESGAGTRARLTALENIKNNVAWADNNTGMIRRWLKGQTHIFTPHNQQPKIIHSQRSR